MSTMMSVWRIVIVLACFSRQPVSAYTETPSMDTFIQSCRRNSEESNCLTYTCFARNLDLDLRHLASMRCRTSDDCRPDLTDMVCNLHKDGLGYCECPRYTAYNATSCACQEAKMCPPPRSSDGGKASECHNGMKCLLESCSCEDMNETLFDHQGGFCVLPRQPGDPDYWGYDAAAARQKAFWIVLCVIGGLLGLGVIAIAIYVFSDKCCECQKGDYECEDEKRASGDSDGVNHIATWDMPTMDYLSEEQTMKYLRTHHHYDNGGYEGPRGSTELEHSESSTRQHSPVNQGSLPESDRHKGHLNEAYDDEEREQIPKETSDYHDV